jgi:curved DNA-binding protein CbpA
VLVNLYDKLGVEKDAPPEKIKRAYRKRAAKVHPDVAPGKEKEFLALVLARDVLLNPEDRAHYDATGEMPKAKPGITPALILIRQIAVMCAAKDPKQNLLGAIREQLKDQIFGFGKAIDKCHAAITEIEKRWHEDEIRAQVLAEFEGNKVAAQQHRMIAEAALELLKDAKYDGIDVINEPTNFAFGGWVKW